MVYIMSWGFMKVKRKTINFSSFYLPLEILVYEEAERLQEAVRMSSTLIGYPNNIAWEEVGGATGGQVFQISIDVCGACKAMT